MAEPAVAPAAVTNEVSNNAAAAASNAINSIKSISMNNGMLVSAMIIVAAVAFAVAYALYYMINNAVLSKKGYLIPATKVPIMGTQLTKIGNVAIPAATNGKRLTLSFWLYIHDIEKFKGSVRHVFHVGDEDMLSASPIVFLNPNDNRLSIAFGSVDNAAIPAFYNTLESKLGYIASQRGITINYVPINRWVHVAVVVNEDASGGSISAYLDSELVSSIRTGQQNMASNVTEAAKIQNLKLDRAGSMFVGGSTNDEIGPGFSGLVSKVKLFNYDLNVGDVYKEYRAGPVDNLLSKLGLPPYGVRSPVYRIS